MKFSKTPPTGTGFFWWRLNGGRPEVVRVVSDRTMMRTSIPGVDRIDNFGEWGDEIPLPEPDPFVPTEPGEYYATFRSSGARHVVRMASTLAVFAAEVRGVFAVDEFKDWSERITDPGPKKL